MMTKRLVRRGLAVLAIVLLPGCSTDELLNVDNPDVIDPEKLVGAKGAAAMYAGALGDLSLAHDGSNGAPADGINGLFGGVLMTSGLFTDEYRFGGTPPEVRQLDLRDVTKENSFFRDTYLALHRARESAERAAQAITDLGDADDKRIGEMYAVSALVHILLGEHFCGAVPFSTTRPAQEYGDPLTTQQIMDRALERLDIGAAATGGDADIGNLIAVLRGRALLNNAQYGPAATAVAAVPTAFEYRTYHSDAAARTQNLMKGFIFDFDYLSVSDGEGGNGLNFATAGDPRVPTNDAGLSRFDDETPHFQFLKYDSFAASVIVASGVEARLIEAEALLKNGDAAGWLAKLTVVRTFFGMGPVADPGSTDARVNLMFRERAFSLFSTGHRLGDLRRLVRQYGRTHDQVFPVGAYHKDNLTRGTNMSFVIPASEENNPKYTADLCNANGA